MSPSTVEALSLDLVATAHLVTVDIAMAAPVVCLWLQWRAAANELARRLDRYLLRLSIVTLVLAIVLGGLAAALIWRLYPQPYLNAFHELPRRRYEFGVVELVFTLACYAVALRVGFERTQAPDDGPTAGRGRFAVRWWATLLGALNLAYHFPPLFVMLGVLTSRPDAWGRQARFITLLVDREILARTVHHWLAAAVVAGLAMTCYGIRRGGQPSDRPAVVWGGRLAAAAMLLQIVSGAMLVAELPIATRRALLGDDFLATGLFAAALLATFFALPRLGAIALGYVDRRHALGSCLLVLLVVFLMTAARHRTRDLLLEDQRRAQVAFDRSCLGRYIFRHAHGTDHALRRRHRRVGQNPLGPWL